MPSLQQKRATAAVDRDDSVTYDPFQDADPTGAQLESINQMGPSDLNVEDLANPEAVKLLLMNQRTTLLQYRKAEEQIDGLREEKEQLGEENSDLRVKVAHHENNEVIAWLEVLSVLRWGFP